MGWGRRWGGSRHYWWAVAVRDSKSPQGPVLSFTREEWSSFIAGVKAGEFDVEALGDELNDVAPKPSHVLPPSPHTARSRAEAFRRARDHRRQLREHLHMLLSKVDPLTRRLLSRSIDSHFHAVAAAAGDGTQHEEQRPPPRSIVASLPMRPRGPNTTDGHPNRRWAALAA